VSVVKHMAEKPVEMPEPGGAPQHGRAGTPHSVGALR
jgi:hypothetical protein